MKSRLILLTTFSLLLLFGPSLLMAGNTGKIIGRVIDDGGQPIPGVTILVVGTQRGAATDPEGRYAIIGIQIGSYTVQARGVGYNPKEVINVKVGADETTSLNFTLTSDAVKMQEVVISADANLVNSLATSSTQTVSSKSIESIPNVKSVEDVLKLQAGVVKQGNNLFLRGGRANEVQYLVDGIPSNNVSGGAGLSTAGTNEELQKYYSGNANGTIGGGSGGLAVSANSIASVSVQTSGFDADYGNAQSGVINIVTKSGSDHYSSSLQYRTDRISASNQNENYTSFTFGGPEPITKYVMPSLGVNIPGNLTFFFSTDIDRADGAYNFVDNQFYHPLERKVELNGFLGGLLNGLGFRFRDNQRNAFTFNSKLKYDMSGSDQFSYGYRASLTTSHGYDQYFKFRADSSALSASLAIQNILSWTHFFSTNTFVRLYLAKLENKDGNDVAGIKPFEYSNAYQQRDPNGDGFFELGTAQGWYSANTKVWTARVDFNSQVHALHLLKTGFEFNYEEILSTSIDRPTVSSTDSAGNVINPPFPAYKNRNRGEYPGYGIYRWATTAYPNRGGAYVQDNIEFSGLNIHVGMRYDYFDIGKQVYDPDWVEEWKAATINIPADWVDNQKNGSSFLYYLTHGYVSPRLSIGYPVTERIVFYFNYGHFLQFPDRDNYYRDPFGQGPPSNLVGNPNLKPQRTVAYEAGFEDQFSDDMAFAVHAFYKDIFEYPTTVSRGTNNIYVNFDYASARGFELTFNQAFSGNFSMAATYSYQLAKGRSSNPLATLINPQFQLPRETRLDWDQNHTANFFTTYRVGPKGEGKFFGLPFINNYGVSLTWQFGSGFPYTPFSLRTTARNVYLVNNSTMPFSSTVNFSFYKGFLVMDHMNMVMTLDITNLLNRRNVNSVFNYSGAPYKFGDIDGSDVTIIYPYRSWDFRNDPRQFQAPRQIIFGLRLNWD